MLGVYDALASVCWIILLKGDKVFPEGIILFSNLTLSVILFLIPTAGWSKKNVSILVPYSTTLLKVKLLLLLKDWVILYDPVILGWIEEVDTKSN